MATIMCIPCSMEFSSEKEFQAHKVSGHTTKGKPLTSPDVPADITPTPEFLEAVERIENKKAEVTSNVEGRTDTSTTPLPEKIDPVKLTYLFKGSCPKHRVAVETYEVDVMKKHIVLAICPRDKEQLLSLEVAKLD